MDKRRAELKRNIKGAIIDGFVKSLLVLVVSVLMLNTLRTMLDLSLDSIITLLVISFMFLMMAGLLMAVLLEVYAIFFVVIPKLITEINTMP